MSLSLVLQDANRPAELDEPAIVFVGGASVLLRSAGFTVLVDPTFLHHGDHVHLGYSLGASGGANEGFLPPVDLVLVPRLSDGGRSRTVDRELERRLPVLATRRAATTLRQKGFVAAKGLASWETIRVARGEAAVRVTATPAHPASVESFLPDAMGSILEFEGSDGCVRLRVYVSSDSLVHGDLRDLPRRPGVDLALFALAGTRVAGVLAATEEGGATVRLVVPRTLPGVPGEDHGVESPLERLTSAVLRAGLEAHVDYVDPGEGYVIGPKPPWAVPETPETPPRDRIDAGAPRDGHRPVAA